MLRTFRTAVLLASFQAVVALVLAIASEILLTARHGDASLLYGAALPHNDSMSVWLDMYYRLTAADVAVSIILIALFIDAIRLSAMNICRAVHALNPKTPRTTLERMTALCGGAVIACIVGLSVPPAPLLDLAIHEDLWSSLVFLWATALTVGLAFFSAILIGVLEATRREPP
jgi:hypothetical protein